MVLHFYKKSFAVAYLFIPIVIVIFSSCQQYEYASPAPGTVSLRLRSYYTQFDTLFSDNNFTLKVTEIKAVRSDGILANVYEDVKSIGPTPDIYNVLGRDAYDSVLVIGEYPLPPGDYRGLILKVEPGPRVILDGYRSIPVEKLPSPLYSATVIINQGYRIEEARVTSLVITVDLDVTLSKLAYSFQYVPRYFISSESIH